LQLRVYWISTNETRKNDEFDGTYAGGRGIEFEAQTSVMAHPLNQTNEYHKHRIENTSFLPTSPIAMRNREKYRALTDMVQRLMMNPTIIAAIHIEMWKKRSPALSIRRSSKFNSFSEL
jgi:hypothetical protein